MRILLVNPPFSTAGWEYLARRDFAEFATPDADPTPGSVLSRLQDFAQSMRSLPLGLLIIREVLRRAGHEAEILNLQVQPFSRSGFIRELEARQPRMVGVSVLTQCVPTSLEIAEAVKEWSRAAWTVFGGPHVTFRDRDTLANPAVDFAVRNEGEDTILELVSALEAGSTELEDIRGLSFVREDAGGSRRAVRNPGRPLIQDLDRIPIPDRSGLPEQARIGLVASSRGCPAACLFCCSSALAGARFRARSPENVVEEMCYLHDDLGTELIDVVDDAMTTDRERMFAICRLLKDRNRGIHWSCMSRADVVTREELEEMFEAGCVRIHFGLESGDPAVLRSIGKRLDLDRLRSAVALAKEVGMQVTCSYMIGHHTDTTDSIDRTLELVSELRSRHGIESPSGINTPFPGTPLFEHSERLGVSIVETDWAAFRFSNCVIRTRHLEQAEIQYHFLRSQARTVGTNPMARQVLKAFGMDGCSSDPAALESLLVPWMAASYQISRNRPASAFLAEPGLQCTRPEPASCCTGTGVPGKGENP